MYVKSQLFSVTTLKAPDLLWAQSVLGIKRLKASQIPSYTNCQYCPSCLYHMYCLYKLILFSQNFEICKNLIKNKIFDKNCEDPMYFSEGKKHTVTLKI